MHNEYIILILIDGTQLIGKLLEEIDPLYYTLYRPIVIEQNTDSNDVIYPYCNYSLSGDFLKANVLFKTNDIIDAFIVIYEAYLSKPLMSQTNKDELYDDVEIEIDEDDDDENNEFLNNLKNSGKLH